MCDSLKWGVGYLRASGRAVGVTVLVGTGQDTGRERHGGALHTHVECVT